MKKGNVLISLALILAVLGVVIWEYGGDLELALWDRSKADHGALSPPEPLHAGEAKLEVVATVGEISIQERAATAAFGDAGYERVCQLCHDRDNTKSFHVPEKIIKIEAMEGKRRRLCPDCHGLEGADPDRKMTDPEDIRFDPNVSVNGLFRLDKDVPHDIHMRILASGRMECGACHFKDYSTREVVIPEANADDGQILLCQNCKFHPERGNYIAIHVEVAGKGCSICHTGDILDIHREATAKLGTP